MTTHIAVNATTHYPPTRRQLRRWLRRQHRHLAPRAGGRAPRVRVHGRGERLRAVAWGDGWTISYRATQGAPTPRLHLDAHAQHPDPDLFIHALHRALACERTNWAVLWRDRETTIQRRGTIARDDRATRPVG